MQQDWALLKEKIDQERFDHVAERLTMQLENAKEWRDVCV
jgi:alpha-glucuronidase